MMSDKERVIKGLEYCIGSDDGNCSIDCPFYEECYLINGSGPFIPALRAALKELKEQEPMMVRLTASTIRCPKCGKQITSRGAIHREIKFCWKCGQAVKWDD